MCVWVIGTLSVHVCTPPLLQRRPLLLCPLIRWWNPAAEMQAIDRTHRLGQFKPIYATRFIIEDTVEERIIKLQVTYLALVLPVTAYFQGV